MKIAIVADQLTKYGGAEFMISVLLKVFPKADLFTSVSEEDFIKEYFPKTKIYTTFIQQFPFASQLRDEYSTLSPIGFKMLDFTGYNLVISVSSAFAKQVTVRKPTRHVMICLTPPRFLWMEKSRSERYKKFTYKVYEKIFKKPLQWIYRKMDLKAARQADQIISISDVVAKRVKKVYKRDSEVIYPPVDVAKISVQPHNKDRGDSFLYLGRVESYKGVDLAVRACIAVNKKLIIAGRGTDLERIKDLVTFLKAEKLIKFLDFVPEER